MPDVQSKVLLIEDDPGYARLIRKALSEGADPAFAVVCVEKIQDGLEHLAKGDTDVVLLDLVLPDSQGLDTFVKVHTHAPEVPIVVLTVVDHDTLAIDAVRRGAQDYLVKGRVDSKTLTRVLRYAIERHRMQEALRSLALIDDLTGLYNRRGFLKLAEHHMKLARRTERGSALMFADLDGLKQINDAFGHQEGDQALIMTAEILKATFRTSDILARIGGDEFAILAIQANEDSAGILTARLQETLKDYNARSRYRWGLSLSVGVAYLDHQHPVLSIEELMAKADAALYEQKRSKRGA